MSWVAPLPEEEKGKPLSPQLLLKVQARMQALLDEDWRDVERGIYPAELLFDNPWDDFLRYYPMLCLDMPNIWFRSKEGRFQDLPDGVDVEDYPSYYRRNFHFQTDGYLSDRSAQMYDLQVEILFNGSADPMRRRILAPLKQGLAELSEVAPRQQRVLDVACGTGRTLRMLRGALPEASLYGQDLSAAYLRKANELLSQLPGELPQLLQSNAETLPYQDGYFQAVSCVFLFHELPGPVRQKIIHECFRVLQAGGTLVICDSVQPQDVPDLSDMLDNFPKSFHEPFYRDYLQDDVGDRLQSAGFTVGETTSHFMSKYWVAKKP